MPSFPARTPSTPSPGAACARGATAGRDSGCEACARRGWPRCGGAFLSGIYRVGPCRSRERARRRGGRQKGLVLFLQVSGRSGSGPARDKGTGTWSAGRRMAAGTERTPGGTPQGHVPRAPRGTEAAGRRGFCVGRGFSGDSRSAHSFREAGLPAPLPLGVASEAPRTKLGEGQGSSAGAAKRVSRFPKGLASGQALNGTVPRGPRVGLGFLSEG